jgi:hypothetical protein
MRKQILIAVVYVDGAFSAFLGFSPICGMYFCSIDKEIGVLVILGKFCLL